MWTNEEIMLLKENYARCRAIDIRAMLNNRSIHAIVSKANRLGLVKEIGSGRKCIGREHLFCVGCGKDLGLVRISRKRKFCNHSCAGRINNKGKVLSEEHRRKISIANKGRKGRPISAEHKEIMRETIQKRYANGWMPKAGRCKKIKYVSPIAGEVLLDGTWEEVTAKWLDGLKILWIRNKKRFAYINLEGNISHYTPDFYVEKLGGYLEVKGYETELDRCKWSQFKENLLVFKKKEIESIKNGEVPKMVKGLVC